MKNKVKISLCQLNFHVGNLKNNFDKIISAREEVKKKGGRISKLQEYRIEELEEHGVKVTVRKGL